MNGQILPLAQINEVKDYPYGRLRTSAFFSVEFVNKKGFRSVFQTIDPKTSRINKPKKGTYDVLCYCFLDAETGHIKFRGFGSCGGDDGINKLAKFLADHKEQIELTPDMVYHICEHMTMTIKAGLYWTHPDSRPAVKELIKPVYTLLAEGMKTKEIDFSAIVLPVAEIKAIQDGGKQIEFVTTSVMSIS